MPKEHKPPLRYRDAGVDIEAGNTLVSRIKSLTKAAAPLPGVLGDVGGFGGLFDLSAVAHYKRPVLVAGTDGVGTKIKLAIESGRHHTIGIDLVAMCVNDIIVQGARPLFFLDYFAASRLDIGLAETVITGINQACRMANCSLLGGETAEMPGMYAAGDYDLAGFCVGAVEKEKIITGDTVLPGDKLIAVPSSGCHANGYSLIRRILNDAGITQANWDTLLVDNRSLIDQLLEPTRIYVSLIMALLQQYTIKAIAHITGGGLTENIPRVIPETMAACIDLGSWKIPAIFEWLSMTGNVAKQDMYHVFNCGVGMVLCVAPDQVDGLLQRLDKIGESAWVLGEIVPCRNAQKRLILEA